MRKFLLVLLFIWPVYVANCQLNYWQQQVNYTIDATLDDKENSIDAFEKIEYINHSPDTLHFIWFHIWPNAYKNDKTAFSDQLLTNNNTKFYFSGKEQRGYINRLDFKVNNVTCSVEDHPLYIDIVKVVLPDPLLPGQQVTLSTPFHVQLPFNFSRGGHAGQSYQVTQWYPKPAVYDKYGWHPMPYLDQGEFYSEFGNFDVRITVPQNYVVAATGVLQNEEEKEWLLGRSHFTWEPARQKTKLKGGAIKTTVQKFPSSSRETKTLRYAQNNIHDFAWFADKRFIVNHDTCELRPGKVVDVFTYYTGAEKAVWENSVQFAKRAIRFYSTNVGEYPFSVVNVVQGPESFGGGMEYPTITVISPTKSVKDLDITIAHEIGHNWFYGILASNERDHPWMDEGINSFYEDRYLQKYYRETPAQELSFFETFAQERLDQPIETPSDKFNETNYDLVAYRKTSEWLRWIEQQIGSAAFDKAMKEYFQRWQFKHPQPEDIRKVFEESSGESMDSSFSLLYKTGLLPNELHTGTKFRLIGVKNLQPTLNTHDQNLITLGPAVGINSYDKLMVGAFITNVKLPLNNLKFFASPMYGLGSKEFTGIGKLDYTFYPGRFLRKIDVFLNAAKFSDNEYQDSAGVKTFLGFRKLVPGIRLTYKERDARSTVHRYIQWKTFFISEDGLNFSRDTIVTGIDTSILSVVRKARAARTLNQLSFVINNYRALYPYRGELKIEQANDFVRAAFTGNYFFNYPRDGGFSVRLFAGKFIYLGAKTTNKQFATERYHLNMTGANGFEDYTFSDYFIGRNKFEGLASQQIMMRDGGFKVKTDLLADKVGKTDDWLIAANFTSSVPPGINPLNLLPVKIPLKVFLDVGTYADAWKEGAELDRFLFDGGLQISLLKNTINIYMPLVYSNIYKDYVQSILEKKHRFFRKISFSIDISTFSLRKIDKILTF